MSDVLKKKERYDYLIDQLTELEIKYSDLLDKQEEQKADARISVLLKDINSIKDELHELDGIHQKYHELLDEKELELRESEDSKEYLLGYDKAEAELNKEIELLQEVLQKHLRLISDYEKVLKSGESDNINKDFQKQIELINTFTKYNIEIKQDLGYTDDEVENWKNLQSLYDTKDMINSAINKLIEKKVELQNIIKQYIEDKVKE